MRVVCGTGHFKCHLATSAHTGIGALQCSVVGNAEFDFGVLLQPPVLVACHGTHAAIMGAWMPELTGKRKADPAAVATRSSPKKPRVAVNSESETDPTGHTSASEWYAFHTVWATTVVSNLRDHIDSFRYTY
jgi:hypothetical protein